MKTVNEVSKIAGISIRTLQYYDKIGLLKPSAYSESGYRLYGDEDLKVLQSILLFKALEFPLKEIKEKQRGNKNVPSTTHADFCRIWQGKITTQRFS